MQLNEINIMNEIDFIFQKENKCVNKKAVFWFYLTYLLFSN